MYQVRQPSLFPFDDSCGQYNDNERLVLVLQGRGCVSSAKGVRTSTRGKCCGSA